MAIAFLSAQIFEHVPHSEDEVAYIFQAKVFAQNRLTVPTPPNSDAFWSPFVVDYQGQRFGKYHPGWPLLLSLGVRLKAPWLINALLGTLTLVLIAWLGHRYYHNDDNPTTCYLPLIAAGLGLLTPGFLFLSSSLLSHAASLFWATVTLVALFQLVSGFEFRVSGSIGTQHAIRRQRLYAGLVGFSLGASFITRPFAALGIGLAMGIFLLILIIRGELKWTVLLWLVLGGLPIAAVLPLYWWAITGDPTFNGYLLVWPYDHIGFGPNVGPLGYTLHDAIFINTSLKLSTLATGLFGWPGWTNLLFLPIPFLTRKTNRWDWLLLGTILGMIFVHIFYWAFGGADGGFPRYYYDALPGLLLLTARGILIALEVLRRRALVLPFHVKDKGETTRREQSLLREHQAELPRSYARKIQMSWLLVGLLVIFVGHNFIFNLPPLLAAQKGKYNITPAPLQVVAQANLSEPALIIIKDVKLWSDFAAPFAANSPTLDGPVVYAADWGVPALREQVRHQFPNRVCWELRGETLQRCPAMEGK